LTPKQSEIDEHTSIIKEHWWVTRAKADFNANLIAVTAGLGSGKTHGAIQWCYDRTVLNNKSPFSFYMMPIYELLHNTAIPVTRKVLGSYGLIEGTDYTILKSPFPKCIFNATKQELHYISGNRPEKIKSVQYSHGVVDEPGVTDEESYKRVRERTRDMTAVVNQIILPGTPEGINWFADEFDSDTGEGWDRSRDRDHTLIRQVEDGSTVRLRRFRLTTYDNQIYLPPGYISSLLDTHRDNQAYIDSYVFGRFVPLVTGNCYGNYKPQKHKIPNLEPSPYRDIYLTWDFNASPLTWISVQEFPFTDPKTRTLKYVAIHEASKDASLIDDACVEFRIKHPVELFKDTPICSMVIVVDTRKAISRADGL